MLRLNGKNGSANAPQCWITVNSLSSRASSLVSFQTYFLLFLAAITRLLSPMAQQP